jgi:hypothetical protein
VISARTGDFDLFDFVGVVCDSPEISLGLLLIEKIFEKLIFLFGTISAWELTV